ncbi:hypothetical protein [Fervidobacterium sp.]
MRKSTSQAHERVNKSILLIIVADFDTEHKDIQSTADRDETRFLDCTFFKLTFLTSSGKIIM